MRVAHRCCEGHDLARDQIRALGSLSAAVRARTSRRSLLVTRLAYLVVVDLVCPRHDDPRAHRIRQGQPGQDQLWVGGPGHPAEHFLRTLQDDDRGKSVVHVPYKGGAPAVADLISGHVQVIFAPVSESIQQVKAGKLRPLAVTTATRFEVFPDVPTVGDFVSGYEASGFAGIGMPERTLRPKSSTG